MTIYRGAGGGGNVTTDTELTAITSLSAAAAASAASAAASAASITSGSVVTLTGNQTVAGIKTFSSTIVGGVSGNAGSATTLAAGADRTKLDALTGTNTGDQTLPVASSTTPAPLGTAAVGVAATFARADHVHLQPSLATLGAQAAGTYASGTGSASGTNTGDQTTITGNAGSATTLSAGVDRTKLDAVTGTNTGDETLATIKTKLGITTLSGSNTGDQTISLTGDATGSGTGSFAVTLANTAATPGSYTNANVTVNAKGLITSVANGTASGTGTVTSASVTTANGVSGVVATATTTPAITLTLGAITPSSVAATGAVTGSNLSGTNTGDQTNISGNAATVTTNANLTGVVTSVGNATAIADTALSIAKTSGLQAALNAKQDTLVSATNIKTINSTSLLGSGDIVITGSGGPSAITISGKTAAYTVVAGDLGAVINCTSGTFTVSLTAAATLGAGFNCTVWNTNANSAVITIDPAGTETIDGKSTFLLGLGQGAQVVSTGTNWELGNMRSLRLYSDNMQLTDGAKPRAIGTSAVAIGLDATASGNLSIASGFVAASSGEGSLALGYRATASSTVSTAIGANSSYQGSQAVTGAGAMALGGSYASGADSFAAAVGNNTSSYGAAGASSIAVGRLAAASGSRSVVLGGGLNGGSVASGSGAIAIGDQCTASGTYSIAMGGGAQALQQGKMAISSRGFSAPGLAQAGTIVLWVATTDATATALRSNGDTASTLNQLILPNNSAYTFDGIIIARQSAANGSTTAAWKVEGLIRREGTAASTVLVVSTVTMITPTTLWILALTADTTNGGLAVTFTGAAATNIKTVATLRSSEVTYA